MIEDKKLLLCVDDYDLLLEVLLQIFGLLADSVNELVLQSCYNVANQSHAPASAPSLRKATHLRSTTLENALYIHDGIPSPIADLPYQAPSFDFAYRSLILGVLVKCDPANVQELRREYETKSFYATNIGFHTCT